MRTALWRVSVALRGHRAFAVTAWSIGSSAPHCLVFPPKTPDRLTCLPRMNAGRAADDPRRNGFCNCP